MIGESPLGFEPSVTVTGRVVGTAPLTTFQEIIVGHAWGASEGRTRIANGFLEMHGADLTSDRNWIAVGYGSGGAGTNIAQGSLLVDGGDVSTDALWVGLALSTQKASAQGKARVVNGNITAMGPNFPSSNVRVGFVETFSFSAVDAFGELELVDGDLETRYLEVGRTFHTGGAGDSAIGRLTVQGGNVSMLETRLGDAADPSDFAQGLLELFGGTMSGQLLKMGHDGKLVLGIEGMEAGIGYGRALLARAELNGAVEARFGDNFQPAPGSVFELVSANSIVGDYDFEVTGLDLGHPPLTIERTSTRIRLVFAPEPSTLAMLALTAAVTLGCRPSIRTRQKGSLSIGSLA